jgi:phage baseplate assembly protein gpV
MKEIVELIARVGELERRLAAVARHGTVHEVDAKKALVRLKLAESSDGGGGPFLSPWVPYSQIAGAFKHHTPPSVGQQMSILSPMGDWGQAVAHPFHWSNQNKSPSDKPDQHVFTVGNVKITHADNLVKMEVGKAVITATKDYLQFEHSGSLVRLEAGVVHTTAAKITHNGVVHDLVLIADQMAPAPPTSAVPPAFYTPS